MKKNPRVIVITGASAGLGRATAIEFAREGARIGLVARGEEGLRGAKRDVEMNGGEALIYQADVANAEQVEKAAAAVEEKFGPIDVWVNNAMVSVFSPVKETPSEEFQRVINVTYMGYVNGTLSALRRMLPRDEGIIIQVGSALAYRGIPLQAAYCASKHAIEGFRDSLRCELLHDRSRVRVTMLQMPALNTPQFGWVKSRLKRKAQPVPPIFAPRVGARAIVYASHHPRRDFLVGIPTLKAVLVNRIVPGLLDWYLAKTGYKSQQLDEPEDPNRPNNLWNPVLGDHGAEGDFSNRQKTWSPALWASMNRSWIACGFIAAIAILLVSRSFSKEVKNCCRFS